MAADTRLDHRWIDLRTPANQAIFKIQSAVCQYFRANLASKVCLWNPASHHSAFFRSCDCCRSALERSLGPLRETLDTKERRGWVRPSFRAPYTACPPEVVRRVHRVVFSTIV